VIFDRSGYNRAGVERVMGFAKQAEVEKLLKATPLVEKAIVDSGVILLTYWSRSAPTSRRCASPTASTTGASCGASNRRAFDRARQPLTMRIASPLGSRSMNSALIAILVFVCVFGGALAGIAVRVPSHHQDADTRDVVKLVIGLIATIAALVLSLLYEQAEGALSWPFLVVLVFWLVALFAGFGLYARGNATVIAALFVGALTVAGAIFLILEMNRPYSGFMQISSAPIRNALAQIGR
jgi:hypothetical protein